MTAYQIIALAVALTACAHTSPQTALPVKQPQMAVSDEEPRVPDEYLITLSPDADKAIIAEYYGKYGIKDIFALGGETYLLVLRNDPGPQTIVSQVFDDDRIMAVQPNIVYWDYRSGSITK